jgi:TRAP-type C4-dicarboxylate transport system permease small subunit
LRRAADVLLTALRIAAGAMLIASVSINFANIIGRYFLSVSLS